MCSLSRKQAYMKNTRDKGKRPTKASASSRREKVTHNPPKKWSRKHAAQTDAVEIAHPEPEDTEMEIHGDDVVRELEEVEMERKGDESTSKVRRPA
ncbi:hypothetical protein TSUD_148610 [Trifolium subterraneum]|uniref:Uncharacterized protein n=1 Tax=Trifolium subterraneum TaxID=3900 RepID=A0A2Z6NBS2_TRISU|nr:hypothetical protein TSUD_148610 [Trifolium subterraneum]